MSGESIQKLNNHPINTTIATLNNCTNQQQQPQHQQQQHQHQQLTLIKANNNNNNNNNFNNNRYIKLNVGGRLFTTSIDTLTKQDNMLRAMFSGRMELITDSDGYTLIDRSGKHFEKILNYLRDEDCLLDDLTDTELYELLKESKFYCIQPLISQIEHKLLINKNLLNEPYYGSAIVSMITSKAELNKILSSTNKPIIRLLINRHNNKYSYTGTSDDNLLKNIELFERMAIKFKNRILFIKDTASNEEICCWYFHGDGKKLSEVCCTSIVYSVEKKQTKVEFPDAKILEEIFVNAVLFESKETNESIQQQQQQYSSNVHSITSDDDIDELLTRAIANNQQSTTAIALSNGSSINSNSTINSINNNSAPNNSSTISSTTTRRVR